MSPLSHDWIDGQCARFAAVTSHLKQHSGAIDVALFLPFGCYKRQQRRAKRDSMRKPKIVRFLLG